MMDKKHHNQEGLRAVCPVCHYSDSQTLFLTNGWESFDRNTIYSIRLCSNCGTSFTSPNVTLENLSEFYSKGLYGNIRNRMYVFVEALGRVFQRCRLRKITRYIRKGKLLDVGCGKGRFLAHAASQGWDVYGIEPSINGRETARRRLGDRVFESFKALNLDEKYDVITLWHVLEHVSDPASLLEKIHTFLRPGGLLCVAVPNFASLQAHIGGEHWSHLDVPRHIVHYTPETLSNLLVKANFSIVAVDHYSIEFNPIGVVQTALNLLGCEPGFIYSLIKRNLPSRDSGRSGRFLYSLLVAAIGIPLLLLPAFLFSFFESLIGRGGSILIISESSKFASNIISSS